MKLLNWRRWISTHVGVGTAIVLFNAILIGVLWTAVFARVQDERQDAIRAATERDDNLAVAFEQYTGRIVESADAQIQQLIRAHAGSGGSMGLESFLADFTIDDKVIIGFVLADEHGNAESSAYLRRSVKPINVRDREHFRIHIGQDSGKVFIGKPVVGRLSGQWVIPVTRRINKADGTFGGVAIALIEPGRFTDVLHDAKRRPLDIISLVGLDGITRARLKGTTASTGEDIGKSPLFAERARRPVGNYLSEGQLDNVARLISYRTLPDYQVMVIVGSAEADVLAGTRREETHYFWAAGLISAFIAAFTVLLMLMLARQRVAAAKMARSEARFRAIFEQAAVGIAHTSLDRRYLQVNRKFCDMLGYSQDELLAMRSDKVSLPGEQEQPRLCARACGRDQHVLGGKTLCPQGRQRPVDPSHGIAGAGQRRKAASLHSRRRGHLQTYTGAGAGNVSCPVRFTDRIAQSQPVSRPARSCHREVQARRPPGRPHVSRPRSAQSNQRFSRAHGGRRSSASCGRAAAGIPAGCGHHRAAGRR
jgi:PAS domain S-box-containing protein